MPDDQPLFERLKEAVSQIDPVPPSVEAAALGAFAWRTIDAEIAQLSYDSLYDSPALAVRSGAGTARLITFEGSWLTVDCQATRVGETLRIVGHIIPAQPAHMEIQNAGETVSVQIAEDGQFSAAGIAPGPVSFILRDGGSTLKTDWIVL